MTFLFTDVEGSTRLWEHDRESMRDALERHDRVLRAAITAHGGVVFATGGDGFAVAFARAADALAAAVAAQAELAAGDGAVPIRVRMGVHTGEALEREGDYFGPAVNRAARLMAAAHGGQVLCSAISAGLAAESLPEGCALLDLGVHRLRDLSAPEHVHQLAVDGSREEFPAIRSLDAFPSNLPVLATGFVGRDHDLREVLKTLVEARVVTLTGVGGVGKTRLALQAAAEALPRFRDGAWLVDLGGVGSPDAVPGSVASALGVQAAPGTSVAASIESFVRSKQLLLLLDNCEHLLAPVAKLVEWIVQGAPDVRVLATSREGLGVMGEFLRAVPPLDVPAPGNPVDMIASASSVRLFVERAQQASTTFEFGFDQAEPIAELCRRLDGIPLAIELAAARVPAMTPAEITAHLDRRFRLLTGGRRSAVSRHQTLRNTIDWSYQLLERDEQGVLDRLAVFAGSFDLAAAEAVAAEGVVDRLDVLDLLARLVAKSLLAAEPRGITTRYRLLDRSRLRLGTPAGER